MNLVASIPRAGAMTTGQLASYGRESRERRQAFMSGGTSARMPGASALALGGGLSAFGPSLSSVPSAGAAPGVPDAGDPGGVPLPVPPPGRRENIIRDWPLRDAIEFGPLPGAVPCARLHARQMLWEWGLTQLSDDTELLVSELVTNAIAVPQHGDLVSPVRIWLRADRARVLILVWDASPQPPVPEDAPDDAESGRGLLLVDAVSTRWDWYFPLDTGGMVVWALAGREPRR
jgi:anti-sigma regulatory factor (Ser/Thr protein kinase)